MHRNVQVFILILTAFILTGHTLSDQPRGVISLSPQTHEINLDERPRTHVYRISNLGMDPVEIEVEVLNWEQDEAGRMVVIPPEETSLDQWFIINPVRFQVPPGETRAVRFAIRPAVEMPPGEHMAMVVFQQVGEPPPQVQETGQIRLTARFRLQSAVYATVGPVERTGEIVETALTPEGFLTRIKSTSGAHVRPRGHLQIWESAQFPGITRARAYIGAEEQPQGLVFAGPLNERPVMSGNTRSVIHAIGEVPLPPGTYHVVVTGSMGDDTLEGVWEFELPDGNKD